MNVLYKNARVPSISVTSDEGIRSDTSYVKAPGRWRNTEGTCGKYSRDKHQVTLGPIQKP